MSKAADRYDQCNLPESVPHCVEPAGKKEPGRPICRAKGGTNTKLHAVTDSNGRPLSFFMIADQVSNYTGATALLDSLPKTQWLLGERATMPTGSVMLFRQEGSVHIFPGENFVLVPSNTTSGVINAATASRLCSAASRAGGVRPLAGQMPHRLLLGNLPECNCHILVMRAELKGN